MPAVPQIDARRYSLADFGEEREERPALLLHSCCGPCSTAVVERLSERFRITIYFCNSNIDDEAEYKRRLDAQRAFVEAYNAAGKSGKTPGRGLWGLPPPPPPPPCFQIHRTLNSLDVAELSS